MRLTRLTSIALALPLCVSSLSACSGVKEQLGLDRRAPDEFTVLKRAPLEIPGYANLPTPRLGAPRPQEKTVATKAQQALFGDDVIYKQTNAQTGESEAESVLLQKAGALEAEPDIRSVLQEESDNLQDTETPVAKRLLGMGGTAEEAASVIDPVKEMERLRAEQGTKSPAPSDDDVPHME